jgi:hypothetical protein
VYQADIVAGVQRAPATWGGLSLGADIRGTLVLTRHRYADPQNSRATFLVALATIGPAVAYHHDIAGGVAAIRAGVPVAGLVSHPYSGLKSDRRAVEFDATSLASLRAAAIGASYSAFVARATSVRYEYELRFMRYDDIQPVRSASQSLRVGLEHRFGRQR